MMFGPHDLPLPLSLLLNRALPLPLCDLRPALLTRYSLLRQDLLPLTTKETLLPALERAIKTLKRDYDVGAALWMTEWFATLEGAFLPPTPDSPEWEGTDALRALHECVTRCNGLRACLWMVQRSRYDDVSVGHKAVLRNLADEAEWRSAGGETLWASAKQGMADAWMRDTDGAIDMLLAKGCGGARVSAKDVLAFWDASPEERKSARETAEYVQTGRRPGEAAREKVPALEAREYAGVVREAMGAIALPERPEDAAKKTWGGPGVEARDAAEVARIQKDLAEYDAQERMRKNVEMYEAMKAKAAPAYQEAFGVMELPQGAKLAHGISDAHISSSAAISFTRLGDTVPKEDCPYPRVPGNASR